jgi:hypothetical protein
MLPLPNFGKTVMRGQDLNLPPSGYEHEDAGVFLS